MSAGHEFNATPVWAACLGVALLLLLAGRLRGGLRTFAAIVLTQVGLFGLLHGAGRREVRRPPDSFGNTSVFFPIPQIGPGVDLTEEGPVDSPPVPAGPPAPPPSPAAAPPAPDTPAGAGLPKSAPVLPATNPGPLPPLPAPADPAPGAGGSDRNEPARAGLPDGPDAGTLGSGKPFFPVDAGEKKVRVFVIDRSGSMGSDRRLERVKDEVEQRIKKMSEGVEFGVIFFDARVSWVGGGTAPQLVRKSAETAGKALDELKQIAPGGGTVPLPALLAALRLQPEEICFLTDGEFRFTPQDAQALRKANPMKTATIICTLVMSSNDPKHAEAKGVLEAIAREHGNIPVHEVEK